MGIHGGHYEEETPGLYLEDLGRGSKNAQRLVRVTFLLVWSRSYRRKYTCTYGGRIVLWVCTCGHSRLRAVWAQVLQHKRVTTWAIGKRITIQLPRIVFIRTSKVPNFQTIFVPSGNALRP